MTLKELQKKCAEIIKKGIIPANPEVETKMIIGDLLNISNQEMILFPEKQISEKMTEKILNSCQRRASGEPVQYITGIAYFRELKLKVNKNVLIPRPETEILCDYIIKTAPENSTVLDIGTGSGAIALSLAKECPKMTITAVDICHDALKTAKNNAILNNLSNVSFKESNLFSNISQQKFDVIAANLPYINEKDYKSLPLDVKNYEPKKALFSHSNGLAHIIKTIETAADYLTQNGFIVLEFGYNQTTAVKEILNRNAKYKNITVFADFHGINRFIAATKA